MITEGGDVATTAATSSRPSKQRVTGPDPDWSVAGQMPRDRLPIREVLPRPPAYRRKGPPNIILRLCPVVVVTRLAVLGTGVGLIFDRRHGVADRTQGELQPLVRRRGRSCARASGGRLAPRSGRVPQSGAARTGGAPADRRRECPRRRRHRTGALPLSDVLDEPPRVRQIRRAAPIAGSSCPGIRRRWIRWHRAPEPSARAMQRDHLVHMDGYGVQAVES